MRRTLLRPMPSMDSALKVLECGLLDSTGMSPTAAKPSSAIETPSCSPTHSRPMARPTKLDIVAPVTKAPECSADSPNSSRSQPTVSRSRSVAHESLLDTTFWSNTPVSQSPTTAAAAPPVTNPR